MALISQLPAAEAATGATRALEVLLGHDVILEIGEPLVAAPSAVLLPEEPTRSVALPFGSGVLGEVTLVVTHQFATTMEAATDDSSLVTAALPALQVAADAIQSTIQLQAVAEYAGEIETDTLLTSLPGDFVIVPVLEGDQHVVSLVLRIVEEEDDTTAGAPPVPDPLIADATILDAAPIAGGAAFPEAVPALAQPVGDIALHEFQTLADAGSAGAGSARPLPLLNDVRMEVTAELGRRRMRVSDIVALAPGSVVELDRAAGSPVDVLVNGALIAHGEVVVIDEEFGIRVSEIVVGES